MNKYYFDEFNEKVLAAGSRLLGRGLWQFGDVRLIDGLLVDGSAKAVGAFALVARRVQTGYVYTYAFAMILGLFGVLTWFIGPALLTDARGFVAQLLGR